MKLYLQHLNKADLPATDAILRKVLDVELKEKPINKPNARIYAGYEAGTYYIKCQDGIWLSQIAPLLNQGYKIFGWKSLLLKKRI